MNVNCVDSLCLPPKSLTVQAVSFNPYVCDCTAVTAGFMRSYDRAICTQMYQLCHTHTLDLIPLICQIEALKCLKWTTSWCAINGTCCMVSMVTLWQWWANGRMERNRQRKREVLWHPIVNGRGTLGLLKYDRPWQRRTFCNAMWLLPSVSNHWQVHWECFLIQFPYNVTWPIQHTPMSPIRGTIKTKIGHDDSLSKSNPDIQIRSARRYTVRPIDFFLCNQHTVEIKIRAIYKYFKKEY